MRDHLTKERIQCNACSLLWKVTTPAAPLIDKLVRTAQHSAEQLLRLQLSFWDSENIPVITANGGLHLILAAMTAHPDYAKLQYAAAGVLRAIMGPARAANDRDMRSPSPFMRCAPHCTLGSRYRLTHLSLYYFNVILCWVAYILLPFFCLSKRYLILLCNAARQWWSPLYLPTREIRLQLGAVLASL